MLKLNFILRLDELLLVYDTLRDKTDLISVAIIVVNRSREATTCHLLKVSLENGSSGVFCTLLYVIVTVSSQDVIVV